MPKRRSSSGPIVMHSWRDVGKLGYGSGGHADSPWTRNGIFVMGDSARPERGVNYGGPGLSPARRDRIENPGLKTVHQYVDAGGLCLTCHMLPEGHDRLMGRLQK